MIVSNSESIVFVRHLLQRIIVQTDEHACDVKKQQVTSETLNRNIDIVQDPGVSVNVSELVKELCSSTRERMSGPDGYINRG